MMTLLNLTSSRPYNSKRAAATFSNMELINNLRVSSSKSRRAYRTWSTPTILSSPRREWTKISNTYRIGSGISNWRFSLTIRSSTLTRPDSIKNWRTRTSASRAPWRTRLPKWREISKARLPLTTSSLSQLRRNKIRCVSCRVRTQLAATPIRAAQSFNMSEIKYASASKTSIRRQRGEKQEDKVIVPMFTRASWTDSDTRESTWKAVEAARIPIAVKTCHRMLMRMTPTEAEGTAASRKIRPKTRTIRRMIRFTRTNKINSGIFRVTWTRRSRSRHTTKIGTRLAPCTLHVSPSASSSNKRSSNSLETRQNRENKTAIKPFITSRRLRQNSSRRSRRMKMRMRECSRSQTSRMRLIWTWACRAATSRSKPWSQRLPKIANGCSRRLRSRIRGGSNSSVLKKYLMIIFIVILINPARFKIWTKRGLNCKKARRNRYRKSRYRTTKRQMLNRFSGRRGRPNKWTRQIQ